MPIRTVLTVTALCATLVGCNVDDRSQSSNMRSLPVESITVDGILVDTWCYSHRGQGEQAGWPPSIDTACASESTRLGYPVAIAVDPESLWVLSESPRIFAKFLNDSVRVAGDIRSAGVLIPRTFDRKTDGRWQKIF